MIFKKKKTVLEEQPLCYWEESSYMMAVPKGGGMDLSVRLFERVAAISGVELLKKRLPDEDEPGYMEVGYDGEVYEIGFYEGDFSMPDIVGIIISLTKNYMLLAEPIGHLRCS